MDRLAAQRRLRTVWILLLSVRYRMVKQEDIHLIWATCAELELGVPGEDEYNVGIRRTTAEIRACLEEKEQPARDCLDQVMVQVEYLREKLAGAYP